jgi:hypothetical protein
MKRLVHEPISHLEMERAIREVASGVPEKVIGALLSLVTYDSDYEFVQSVCRHQAKNPDDRIRGIAILCLGHLARVHGKLETERALSIVINALEDPSEYVRGQAITALEEIISFSIEGSYERSAVVSQLESSSVSRIVLGIATIVKRDPDPKFAVAKCLELSSHGNEVIRGEALRGLATLVWDHKPVDLETVIPVLADAATMPGYAGECAAMALEAISAYVEE